MRVVAGTARGRRLVAPAGAATRPTSDRTREAVFNALGSLGVVEDSTVLDLFAGSGAMGIEALSRGAAAATFVDDDSRALEAVRANLDTTGLTERARVVRSTAQRFLAGDPGPFDVAILDPPYRTGDEQWAEVLAAVDAHVVVLEADREIAPGEGWDVLRSRTYGSTVVVVARRR